MIPRCASSNEGAIGLGAEGGTGGAATSLGAASLPGHNSINPQIPRVRLVLLVNRTIPIRDAVRVMGVRWSSSPTYGVNFLSICGMRLIR